MNWTPMSVYIMCNVPISKSILHSTAFSGATEPINKILAFGTLGEAPRSDLRPVTQFPFPKFR
jgi:hypothetical protein